MLNLLKFGGVSPVPVTDLTRERDEWRKRAAELQTDRDALRQRVADLEYHARVTPCGELCYDGDGMRLYGKSTEFMHDPRFRRAYQAGSNSGHTFGEIHVEWRVHIACWAAEVALTCPGDFVECGVNTGILSLAVCNYIDFNATGRAFYLFDTFCGIPEDQMTDEERPNRVVENRVAYHECYETARRNFGPFPRATLVRGKVPETFGRVAIGRVCYLSIDMNIAAPELAAMEYFWDKLSPGAVVVLDDYGWTNYRPQKVVMDAFAARKGVPIATLPTGQGLILKPHAAA